MTATPLLFLVCWAAAPAVNASSVTGETLAGELAGVNETGIVLSAESGEQVNWPFSEVRQLDFPDVTPPSLYADPPALDVILTDGSRLAGTAATLTERKLQLTTEGLGDIELPITQVRALRIGNADDVGERWVELLDRETPADKLVVRKEAVLDFVEGAVGAITPEEISFLLDDRTVSVPRAKVFGVIFTSPRQQPPAGSSQMFAGRHQLQAASLMLNETDWRVQLPAGTTLHVPIDQVHRLEFAGGVRFLADLPVAVDLPDDASHFEQYRFFRIGSEPLGGELKIGAEERRTRLGIWMHSGVTARYRINRDYRRLVGILGMDHNLEQVTEPREVRLVILGDGKELYAETIRYTDRVRDIDLDVTGVRDLEVRAERTPQAIKTNFFAIEEHLDLGFMRLLK
ncbi:MAG: NPCBM/NEW2 domain-containing protein [Planctomycetaceae bacterium]